MYVRSFVRNVLSFRMSGDFRRADLLLLVLFAVIGLQGYSRFPTYQMALQELKAVHFHWALAVAVFNYLLIYRKMRVCYLEDAAGYVATFIVYLMFSAILQIILTATIIGYELISFPSFLATQAGLATFLLVVQGWFSFSPNVEVIRRTKLALVRNIEDLAGGRGDLQATRSEAQSHCERLENELTKVLSEFNVSDEMRADLENLKSHCGMARQILNRPAGAARNDANEVLRRFKDG